MGALIRSAVGYNRRSTHQTCVLADTIQSRSGAMAGSMSRKPHGQRGEARLSTLIWLLLFVALIVVAKEAIPVKVKSSQLEDFMVELAKFASHNKEEGIQRQILQKAQELDLPLAKKSVSVKKSNGRIRMHAEYTIPLEFPFYTYYWHFDHNVDRPVFII